jgi:hypothetical protein
MSALYCGFFAFPLCSNIDLNKIHFNRIYTINGV